MINAIIFDLGAVLIDWNPRHLYRKLFENEADIEHFLAHITTSDWNEEQDAGRSIQAGTDWLVSKYPEHETSIRAFYGRWAEMLGGEITGTVEIFKQLKASGRYKIYALSNWSAETFPIALARYDFLNAFDGLVISGHEGIRKPNPKFYQLLLDRYCLKAEEVLFIDDNLRNVIAAREIGIDSIHFTSAEELQKELISRNVLS
jgi:2-haloacid dehalogenase